MITTNREADLALHIDHVRRQVARLDLLDLRIRKRPTDQTPQRADRVLGIARLRRARTLAEVAVARPEADQRRRVARRRLVEDDVNLAMSARTARCSHARRDCARCRFASRPRQRRVRRPRSWRAGYARRSASTRSAESAQAGVAAPERYRAPTAARRVRAAARPRFAARAMRARRRAWARSHGPAKSTLSRTRAVDVARQPAGCGRDLRTYREGRSGEAWTTSVVRE